MQPGGPEDKPQVIFLVGAGISIPIGIPAMQGMFTSFLDRSKSQISPTDKKVCEFFVNELGVPKDLEEFLLAANSITEFPKTTMDQLVERSISTRKNVKSVFDYRRRLKLHASDADGVRTRILQFMARTCFQFNRERAVALFGPFIEAVTLKSYPVYTTNYDFALEYVAEQANIDVHDNFVAQSQRRLWNKDIYFPLGDALTIVKLHGSVTWYSGADGVIEKIDYYTDINPIGENVERLVIAPTRFKDIYAQNFFALYSHFLTSLSTARVLVVAGHSLRDDYLRAAVVERCRRGDFSLVVVDPTYPALLCADLPPARVGRSGLVTHIPFKFEDFSDEIASIARGSAPMEFADACASVVHQQKARSNKLSMKGNIGVLKVGTTKDFTVDIDAYLHKSEKPARVRIWLSASYKTPDGQECSKISARFLESQFVELGTDWTGVVKDAIPIRFQVPTYPEWLENAPKVTLHAAIVRRSIKTPAQASVHNILAEDSRELQYLA